MNRFAKILLSATVGAAAVAAAATSANAEFPSSANFKPHSERGQWILMLQDQTRQERTLGFGQARQQRRQQVAALQSNLRSGATYTQRQIDPRFLPTVVEYNGKHRPGTIIIDTQEKYLYLVEAGSTARRYGVGVGRPGFQWGGAHKISQKREWPGWTPPPQMRKRQPELPAFMPGGPDNPLGARAMYLGSSLYRIHGSNAPWTIGHEVSSGCFRMRNEDVIDLYERVRVGAQVIVQR
jgi:lipoprotein-anchoring transpeptidase ErfK/SrfK